MLRNIATRLTTRYTQPFMFSSIKDEGQSFLTMVNSYFDKAGIHTGIRSDYLNFYKKPDNVVKCTYPIIRGISFNILRKRPNLNHSSLPMPTQNPQTTHKRRYQIRRKCQL
jgi:hypothetical protein